MFAPEEVIFAPTTQCNLHCAHCRVTRGPALLDAKTSLRFLESCAEAGIDRVGFSGGEPFLRPAFLEELVRGAVERDMLFDRLMTNGVWYRDEAELRAVIGRIEEAGFDGIYGLSVDSWHGQDAASLGLFAKTVFELRGRRDCLEILSVQARDEGPCMAALGGLAEALGGELELERRSGEPLSISDRLWKERPESGEDLPEALFIAIQRFPYSSAMAPETGADPAEGLARAEPWGEGPWFEDDLCAGPGNVLYVHPNGDVAACCGFANENEGLILGNIARDDYAAVMARAAASPQVRTCYEGGLGRLREELEAKGFVFPGRTSDQCFFCDWCAKRGLFPSS